MTELTTAEKLKLARIFCNAYNENAILKQVLAKVVFAARTSGGTAGHDRALCAACDEAEKLLVTPQPA